MPKESLDARLKKSLGTAAGSSMHPTSWPDVDKEEPAEVIPDIREVVDSPAMRSQILQLVTESIEWQQEEKKAKENRKPLIDALKVLIPAHCSASKFLVEGSKVTHYQTSRSSLSKDKLLAAGVSPQIIKACTVESKSYGLKITPAGDVEDSE